MSGIHRKILTGLISLAAFLFISNQAFAEIDPAKLFKGNCASCHKPTDQKLVGPGLLNVKDRWPDEDKLIHWVKNSQEFLKTGDPYANKLFKEFGGAVMPSVSWSDEEIKAVIEWVNKGGDAPAPTPAAETAAEGSTDSAATAPSSVNLTYILIGIGAILLILITVLGSVKKSLQKIANENKGLEPQPSLSYGKQFSNWASNNKKLVAIIGLLLVVWLSKLSWDGLIGIGVYQGYQPEQPIKFSHKLHAGDNQIACIYCHTGAEKSKHANIPSANVCMNCHMFIQEGPKYGKEEISKIYTALDYDPESRTYGDNQKPIKWIRVHSLPDLAYFNHSQHVVVGKVECQTCHGEIQEMEVVSQHAPLTMGWCIDCHRTTEVDFANNGYYEELHKQFVEENKSKNIKGAKFTVEKIGGTECSKCHY